MLTRSVSCALSSVVLVGLAGTAFGQSEPVLVALVGDMTERASGAVVPMRDFGAPSIGVRGDLYFGSRTAVGDVSDGDSIFVPGFEAGARGPFASVVSSDVVAPGSGTLLDEPVTFLAGRDIDLVDDVATNLALRTYTSINASGDFAAWHVTERGEPYPFLSPMGIWRPEGEELRNVAFTRLLDTMPGLLTGPRLVRLTDDGRTIFLQDEATSESDGSDWSGSIFVESGGTVEAVYRSGDPAPGTEGFLHNILAPRAASNGRLAFRASLVADATPGEGWADAGSGVWSGTASELALVARDGSAAPGAGGRVFLGSFNGVNVNSAGDVLFRALLESSTPEEQATNSGLWMHSGGILRGVAREGHPAPGAGAGFFDRFNFGIRAKLGGAGDAIFPASLRGADSSALPASSDTGLWIVTDNTTSLLAREGDAAPGAGGAAFGDFFRIAANGREQSFEIASNNDSDYAFAAGLQAGSAGVVEGVNDFGLWAYDGFGEELLLVARTGDVMDVLGDGTDLRTITDIRFNPLYGLADGGRLGYTLVFADGTSAVYSVVIPSPGAVVVLGVGGLLGVRRRR